MNVQSFIVLAASVFEVAGGIKMTPLVFHVSKHLSSLRVNELNTILCDWETKSATLSIQFWKICDNTNELNHSVNNEDSSWSISWSSLSYF